MIITAQAFQEVPRAHALAVAVGFIPALAAWALFLLETALRIGGTSLAEAIPRFGSDLHIHGVIALSQGFILTSMILAAVTVMLIERRCAAAAAWAFAAAGLSATGVIHAWQLSATGVGNRFGLWAAPEFSVAYGAAGLLFLVLGRFRAQSSNSAREIRVSTE